MPRQVTFGALFLMNPIPHIMIVITDMHRPGAAVETFVILATNLAFWILVGYVAGALLPRSRRRPERRRR